MKLEYADWNSINSLAVAQKWLLYKPIYLVN